MDVNHHQVLLRKHDGAAAAPLVSHSRLPGLIFMTRDQPKSLYRNMLGAATCLWGSPGSLVLIFMASNHLHPPFEDVRGAEALFFWSFVAAWPT